MGWKRPPIQWVTREFMAHLIQKRIDKIKEKEREEKVGSKFKYSNINKKNVDIIGWIEMLLQTPIEDYRKYCLWRISCPYLLNIQKLPIPEAIRILNDWLNKCDDVKKLDFNPQREIANRLRNVGPFLPSSRETLKKQQPELYSLLVRHNIT